ncbi:MAG TPA: outer membrane lipid asymmetry maintenance protein MlaD [Stellaceae bacterium]|nr:outer membrane lipid asymmetry maintenance protein MlaD [Stellaceae bacterium]
MTRNIMETVMGALVLVVAVIFLIFAYSSAQVRSVAGYEVVAKFSSVDGVRPGTDVKISGIKIGSITKQTLDPKTFQAQLTLSIDPSVKLPADTQASITSAGLIGDRYVSLVPGGADDDIPPGGTIKFTQSPANIESLIGQYIFSQSSGKPADGQGNGAGQAGQGAAPGKPAASDLVPKLDNAAPAKP